MSLYQFGDYELDEDSNGNLVIRDPNDNVVFEWNETAAEWQLGSNLNVNQNVIDSIGQLGDAATGDVYDGSNLVASVNNDSVDTTRVENTAISDGTNYIDPRWVARTNHLITNVTGWPQSLDGWTQTTSGSASISLQDYQLGLSTGSTSGSVVAIKRRGWGGHTLTASYANDYSIRYGIAPSATSSVTAYATVGTVADGNKGFGVKFSNGDLLGVMHDGTSETTITLISGYSATSQDIRVEFTSGTAITYYVDGTQAGEITSSVINSGVVGASQFHVENSEASDKQLTIRDFREVVVP